MTEALPIVNDLRNSGWVSQNTNETSDRPWEAAALIVDLVEAGQTVLDGLNACIDRSDPSAVPLFNGIAELHAALIRAGVKDHG